MRKNGITSADVSRGTGIPAPVFSYWKNGRSNPKIDTLQKIADFLGVSLEYLRTGEDTRPSPESIPQLNGNGLSAIEHIKLIEAYTRLSKENQEHILSIMMQLPCKED